MKIRFRKFRLSDSVKSANLIRKTLTTVNAIEYPKKSIQKFVMNFSSQNLKKDAKKGIIYLAFADGKLAGCGKISKDWIRGLFLNPRHMGKEIGAQLLSQLEKAAKKRKTKVLFANSAPGALAFYKKHGYKKVKKIKIDTGGIAYVVKKKI